MVLAEAELGCMLANLCGIQCSAFTMLNNTSASLIALFACPPAYVMVYPGLNRTWFFPQPAKGQIPGSHWHAIYAASYRQTGLPFPLAWSPEDNTVPGVDVTQAYLDAPDTWAPTAVAAAAAAAAAQVKAAAAGVAGAAQPEAAAAAVTAQGLAEV
jgi:hypothetical protein